MNILVSYLVFNCACIRIRLNYFKYHKMPVEKTGFSKAMIMKDHTVWDDPPILI